MKILVVIMQYDYGVKERGYSYEYVNIYTPLLEIYGEECVSLFDFYSFFKEHGKDKTNEKIVEIVKTQTPDITLFCLFKNEIKKETILEINNFTKSFSYFIDDPWRIEFANYWIKYFKYFSTPDYFKYKNYLNEGFKNVLYSPFGFNSSIYEKRDLEKIYDVSFVGGYSPYRKWIFSLLKKEGIEVKTFGRGWNSKKSWVSQDEMVNIFNQSKINLNLSNAISYDFKFLLSNITNPLSIIRLLRLKKIKEQIKGRHYEINGCGGFQLSYYVQSLNLAYSIENEIAVFDNVYNLADTIKFYLKNETLRNDIAIKGYEKSQKEHKAQNYLKNTIEQILQQ